MAEIESLQKRVATVRSELQRMKPDLESALPRSMNIDVILQVVLTSIVRNPKLLDCTPASFYSAIRQACQLGLMPDGMLGEAAIVPFKSEAVFMPMYGGLIKLCYNSEMVEAIDGHLVFEGDKFRYGYGLNPYLEHEPSEAASRTDPKKITHAYAVAWMRGGRPIFRVLTRAEVETYRMRSRAKDEGPWVTDFGPMALKTALLRITKLIPKASENMRIAMAIAEKQEMGETGADVLEAAREAQAAITSAPEKPKALDRLAGKLGSQEQDTQMATTQKQQTPPPQQQAEATQPPAQAPATVEGIAGQGELPGSGAPPQQPSAQDEKPAASGDAKPKASDVVNAISALARQKAVKLTDINAWAVSRYKQGFLECDVLALQGILKKLSETKAGEKFQ